METMEKNHRTDHRISGKDIAWGVLLILLFATAVGLMIAVVMIKKELAESQEQFEMLAKQSNLDADERTPEKVFDKIMNYQVSGEGEEAVRYLDGDTQEPISYPDHEEIDFEKLDSEVNSDIYSWIFIPGTNIDYPILRREGDNSYYLEHNLDGSKGYPGCIYTEDYNAKDWKDPVTVVYGHEMTTTGTMFYQIHSFEEQTFLEENRYLYIYTPERLLTYEIMACVQYSDDHLLQNDFRNKTSFESFFSGILEDAKQVRSKAEDAEITYGDRVVILSTCIRSKPDKRLLLISVLRSK